MKLILKGWECSKDIYLCNEEQNDHRSIYIGHKKTTWKKVEVFFEHPLYYLTHKTMEDDGGWHWRTYSC